MDPSKSKCGSLLDRNSVIKLARTIPRNQYINLNINRQANVFNVFNMELWKTSFS